MKGFTFCSIREKPEYIEPVLETLAENWWGCMPWTKKHIAECMTDAPLPETYVMLEDNKLVGMYTLLKKEILCSTEVGLWIGTLYICPEARGRSLSGYIMEDAEIRGAELGEEKIYLASDHVQFYEKFGFKRIGPDLCAWGEPTQMYEHDTIQKRKLAA
ncbi:MAG: GNAT family N-acetyltransferase [Evtepia sp.]